MNNSSLTYESFMSSVQTNDKPIVIWKNIGWLRGLAISLVVLNHATKYNLFLAEDINHIWSADELALLFFGRCIAPVCTPIFLFAAGYFMGRFSATWKTALAGAKTFATRYALWSLVIYAGRFFLDDDLDLVAFLFGFFIAGKAFPAYWFAVSLIHFYLLTPLLSALVARSTKIALVLAGGLLFVAMGYFYLNRAGLGFLPQMYFTPFVAPYFILGIVFAKHSKEAIEKLRPYRPIAGYLALFLAPLNILESIAHGYLFGDGSPSSWDWDSNDRFSLHVFVIPALIWLVLSPHKVTSTRRVLDWIGMRSLALLLMMDLVMRITFVLLWHAERLLGLTTRPPTQQPLWMGSAYLAIPFTLISLAGPLLTVVLTEKLLGKRIRSFVFG